MLTPLDSWFIGTAGHRSNDTDIEVAPAGMTNRTSIAGGSAGELAVHDTNGTSVAWSATNYVLTAGTASSYRSIAAQIVEYEGPAASGGAARPLSRILNTGA